MAFTGRYFVLVALLQAWIIPKLVSSQQKCLGGFDIYFILDKSGSVDLKYFQNQTVDFVEKTVENFEGKGARFSFITFSSDAETVLKLTSDRAKIKEGLNALRKVQPGGSTMLSGALFTANNQVKNQSREQSAFSIFIILTDGMIHDINVANNQSKRAKQAGTIVYVIGVAAYVEAQLNILASKPPEDFVFTEPSYLTLKNITNDIPDKTCVEITSVIPKQACLGARENSTVTVYGRGFEKFSSTESHSVWCGYKFNNAHRQVTKASLVEENRLVCPLPVLNDTESVLMLQVSLNNGKTFISSNVNISAKNCASGAENKTENGTTTVKETGEGEEKPESEKGKGIKAVPVGTSGINIPMALIVALLGLFAFLILFALWWFWPRFSRKPPRNCEPDSAPEPTELSPNPPPTVQKTASAGKAKWPTVDVSYYGGRSAGGIVPVRVDWGDKKSTEAGARLAGAKPSAIKDPVEPENSTGVPNSSLTPGCWNAIKTKIMAGYRRVASHRPQRGGHWLYSSNPTV